MIKFEHNRKCPKCGQSDIVNEFVKRGDRYYRGGDTYRPEAKRDLIHRHCRNCHYCWNEKPLKNKDENPKK